MIYYICMNVILDEEEIIKYEFCNNFLLFRVVRYLERLW